MYPLFSHFSVVSGRPLWAALYLLLLIGLFFIKALLNKNYLVAIVLVAMLVTGIGLVLQEQLYFLMYLPPVVVSLGLLLLFGRTLQSGSTPLIARYARLLDGELNQEMLRYTRRVTQIWTIFFLVMLIESIGMAIFAPVAIWSLFANVLNYAAIGILFIAEYIYRHRVYTDLPKTGFFQFILKIAKVRPDQLGI